MTLDKNHCNKIVSIENCSVLEIPKDTFSSGDVLMLFNNTDNFICVNSKIENSYKSGYIRKENQIEFPPRSLLNGVFIDNKTIVFSRGII